MAKEKKGQKFGRHSRAPSNAMQQQRTARNKRKNEERAHTMRMQQPEPTKQDYEKVRTDTERDYFMSSEEAKEYGIIDRVIAEH